jgi:hypothetical protein
MSHHTPHTTTRDTTAHTAAVRCDCDNLGDQQLSREDGVLTGRYLLG